MLGGELQTATNTEKLIKDLEDSLEIPYSATLRSASLWVGESREASVEENLSSSH